MRDLREVIQTWGAKAKAKAVVVSHRMIKTVAVGQKVVPWEDHKANQWVVHKVDLSEEVKAVQKVGEVVDLGEEVHKAVSRDQKA
jgi:ABC-type nitrate/sulfonate/bicarbonate transport system ATPase subunit